MSMGKKKSDEPDLWLVSTDLPQSPGHPFYAKLSGILRDCGFDEFCGDRCAQYYAEVGRPSIPPGTYFRLLLVGFFEGIGSERGICWRCSDSLSLRSFLGLSLSQAVPNHSSLCRIRQRLPLGVYREVFEWVLQRLDEEGLVKGKTLAVDATTLEANAAMRSIVRKDSGQAYIEYLEDLAKVEGIESPTRNDLKKLDRKRKKKGSNDDWESPHDPDARITKMKDGRTHLAYKAEHAVDLDTGAILGAEIHPADQGDTISASVTIGNAIDSVMNVCEEVPSVTEVVADKGYHSGAHVALLESCEIRTYISEPDRGRRRWKKRSDQEQARKEQSAVYANRRRQSGERAGRLHRKRAELAERSFAHVLETGGLRRTWLRGLINVGKRYFIQVAAFNLSLIMRNRWGVGTPRAWAASSAQILTRTLVQLTTAIKLHQFIPHWERPRRVSRQDSRYAQLVA
jgi:transposase